MYAPGTVIISAVGEVMDITNVVEPALINETGSKLIYIDFSKGVSRKMSKTNYCAILAISD